LPDLHQIYYQNTNTLLTGGVLREIGTLPNESRAAKLLRIPQLKAEQSEGFTAGLTGKLGKLKLSLDYYNIYVRNRIVSLMRSQTGAEEKSYILAGSVRRP